MSGSQRGAIIGGTWIIGLGAVLLVQQALDLSWARAWPLFLVLLGFGTAVSSVVGLGGRRRSAWVLAWALLWPAIFTLVGLLLFLDFAGLADLNAIELVARWWPVGLIAIGGLVLLGAVLPRARGVDERLSIPTGGAAEGEVVLKFGAGQLEVRAGTPGLLVDGTFEGGVLRRDLGPGRVELETDLAGVWPWPDRGQSWRVGLAPDLPLSLRLEGGASRGVLDLSGLQVRRLVVKTGASDTRITLPRDVDRCEVSVEAGAAQVSIQVPDGVAARIRAQMGLGTTRVNEVRFPRTADGWASADFDAAPRRVEIRAQGGVGSVTIS